MNDIKKIGLKKHQLAVMKQSPRFLQLNWARRTGKTFLECFKHVYEAGNNPYTNYIYVTDTYPQAKRNVWQGDLFNIVPRNWIKSKINTYPQTLTLKNNSTICLFGANNADSIRGIPKLHGAILDEASLYNEYVYTEVVRAGVSNTKGYIWIGGTPKGAQGWFYELYENNNNNGFEYSHITTLDAGIVDADEVQLAQKNLDPKTFNQEYEARFELLSGRVYYTYSENNYTDLEFNADKDVYLCFDFNVDPMTCVIVQPIEYNGQYSKYAAVKEFSIKNSNTSETCEAVINYLNAKNFNGNLEATGDYTGTGRHVSGSRTNWEIIRQYFHKYNNFRIKIRKVKHVQDRVNNLNVFFRSKNNNIRMYINPKQCPEAHKDFMRQSYKATGILDDENGKRGHSADAISYMPFNYHPIEIRKPKISVK